MPDDRREEWIQMLNEPLPGREKAAPTEMAAEDDGQLFLAAMQTHQQVAGG